MNVLIPIHSLVPAYVPIEDVYRCKGIIPTSEGIRIIAEDDRPIDIHLGMPQRDLLDEIVYGLYMISAGRIPLDIAKKVWEIQTRAAFPFPKDSEYVTMETLFSELANVTVQDVKLDVRVVCVEENGEYTVSVTANTDQQFVSRMGSEILDPEELENVTRTKEVEFMVLQKILMEHYENETS
ncbi:MAG: hypothetical protein D6698_05035 [Gammaproteobacteria bacterium]|nr:MAG: hypothetical protein D6698_05035 [Gammaproteobacteria bacterium]